jgi:hypothetical protein
MSPYPYIIVKRVLVALKFPRSAPKFIIYAQAIHDEMKADAQFVALLPKLAILDTNLIALSGNETASKLKPPACTIEKRDASWEVVKDDLRGLGMDVQKLADADKPNAETIITAAGMGTRTVSIRQKQKNTAKDGPVEGSVILTGEGGGPHNWRWSKDNKTWTILLGTLSATKKVFNLDPDELYYFQNSKIPKNEEDTVWSDSVSIILKKYSV